jgi:hypothetical protein
MIWGRTMRWLVNLKGKDVEERRCGLIYFSICLQGLSKATKGSVRTAGLWVEIRTKGFQRTKQTR